MIKFTIYHDAISELSLSGEIGLGKCSKSTVYRWARNINDILACERAGWRVKPVIPTCSLVVIPA